MKNFVLGAMLCAGVSLWVLSAKAEDIYKYDAKGNLIEFTNSAGTSKKVYEYDANDNRISEIVYSSAEAIAANEPSSKSTYQYDDNKNRISELWYASTTAVANNVPNNKYLFQYDLNGNQIAVLHFDSATSTTPFRKFEYEYDANGNKIFETFYNGTANITNNVSSWKHSFTNEYENNNLVSQTQYTCSNTENTCNDTPDNKYVYDYNEAGDMVLRKYYANATAIANNTHSSGTSWSYEYDDYGNIIKKYTNRNLSESHVYSDEYYYNQWLANRKLHYTIQEADELTTNDNNNWVEWTFE